MEREGERNVGWKKWRRNEGWWNREWSGGGGGEGETVEFGMEEKKGGRTIGGTHESNEGGGGEGEEVVVEFGRHWDEGGRTRKRRTLTHHHKVESGSAHFLFHETLHLVKLG